MIRIAYCLPKGALTNSELLGLFPDWSDEKIRAKIGISSRHIAKEEDVLDLAAGACELLFESGVDRNAVDFLILCTQSPVYKLPSTACLLQERLSLSRSIGAFDYNLGCSGFVYGLSVAKGLVASGAASKVLLVTADTYSKYLSCDDRSTRALFGDGAAAVLVDGEVSSRLGAFSFGTDGRGAENLILRDGKSLFMDGPEIFKFSMDVVPRTIKEVCGRNGVRCEDIDLFVFHQANKYMVDMIRRSCALPVDKVYLSIEDIGNTVSSSIPIALKRAEQDGRIKPGMKVMLVGFGVGYSWGGTILSC